MNFEDLRKMQEKLVNLLREDDSLIVDVTDDAVEDSNRRFEISVTKKGKFLMVDKYMGKFYYDQKVSDSLQGRYRNEWDFVENEFMALVKKIENEMHMKVQVKEGQVLRF